MKKLLEYILKNLTGSESVEVEEKIDVDVINYEVKVPQEYVGIIIGKNGKTIKSIRNILRIRATLEKKLVNIDVQEA